MGRPLPDPVLFLDECFGGAAVANALRSAGATVEVLIDHFPAGTEDAVWLPQVGRRGWVVLTKDKRIRHRELERDAVMDAGLALFVLTAGDLKATEEAEAFVRAYPKMRKLLRDYQLPFIASVNASGTVVKLLSESQRLADQKKDAGT